MSESELIYEDDPSQSMMATENIKEEEKEEQEINNHK